SRAARPVLGGDRHPLDAAGVAGQPAHGFLSPWRTGRIRRHRGNLYQPCRSAHGKLYYGPDRLTEGMMDRRQHIVTAFDRDLETIEALLARMGGLVEAAVVDAIRALETRDEEL